MQRNMKRKTKKKRDLIELHNTAESLVYQTEKNLEEFKDKLSDDDAKALKDAVENLKKGQCRVK